MSTICIYSILFQELGVIWDAYGYIFLIISHVIPKFGIVSMNIVIIIKLKRALRKHLLRAHTDCANGVNIMNDGISTVSQVDIIIESIFLELIYFFL